MAGALPLAPWMLALPNRGQLYERLVLDSLPADHAAVARGGQRAPLDLIVREPDGVARAWEIKGNELDARGAFTERRRFSVTPRELALRDALGADLRLCFLWIDPVAMRFGYRVLPADRVAWKSPRSPKYVLPPSEAFPLDRDLRPYRAAAEGRRLAAAWDALPEGPVPSAAGVTTSLA